MNAGPALHPSTDTLQAYGLGKLHDAASNTVVQHLETCADCRRLVAGLSADSFVDRLRDAKAAAATPAPDKALAGVAGADREAGQEASGQVPEVPAELAGHPQYAVIRELGRGGMGVVYLARNKLMDRLEVLKVVNKLLLDRPGTAERFLREIRAAAQLNHAHVVTAYTALQLGELLVFAMEYVPGTDLANLVQARGPLPVLNACYYVQQAALGLQHAYERGMVHRDIKPQNLILAREGKKHVVKVLDFGLAKATQEKAMDRALTGEGGMMGTPDYMAPEQMLNAARADIRADIYSLGCTLYYLLSGAPPFQADSLYAILHAQQTVDARPLNLVRPEVPAELAAVVAKMMAKEPGQRYQKPIEVVQALAPFLKPKAKEAVTSKPDSPLSGEESDPVRWDTLVSVGSTSVEPQQGVAAGNRRLRIGAAAALAVLLLGLVGLWGGGVFKLKTKDGTIVLENLPDNAEVFIDGEGATVKMKDGKTFDISVAPGKRHQLEVKRDGFTVFTREVEIDAGARLPISVRLEPLVPPLSKRPPAVEEEGFVRLFNGKDLTGWVVNGGDASAWQARDGELVAFGTETEEPRRRCYLLTAHDYSDCILRFDFKQVSGADATCAVAFRAVPGETRSHSMQAGPNDSWHLMAHFGGGLENTGALILSPDALLEQSFLRPDRLPTLKDVGAWNAVEIEMRGQSFRMLLNGREVQNVMLNRHKPPQSPGIGLNRYSGRVGFQQRTGEVRFRNVEIKELAKVGKRPAFVHGQGEWMLEGEEIIQPVGDAAPATLLFGDASWTDYDMTVEARRVEGRGPGMCGVAFRVKDFFNFWGFVIGSEAGGVRRLSVATDGRYEFHRQGEWTADDHWHRIAVKVRGNRIQCYLDGELSFDVQDDRHPRGNVALVTVSSTTAFRSLQVVEASGRVLVGGIHDLQFANGGSRSGLEEQSQDLAKEGSVWRGRLRDFSADSLQSDQAVEIRIVKREGTRFQAELWVPERSGGVKIEGNVDPMGNLSYTATRALPGKAAWRPECFGTIAVGTIQGNRLYARVKFPDNTHAEAEVTLSD